MGKLFYPAVLFCVVESKNFDPNSALLFIFARREFDPAYLAAEREMIVLRKGEFD